MERTREIYELEILEIKGKTFCSASSVKQEHTSACYAIRLGKSWAWERTWLNCAGRIVYPFTERDNLITLNDLQDAYYFYKEENNPKFLLRCIQPIENALRHMPKCWILDTTVESISHGRNLAIPGISKLENFRKGEIVAVITLKEELVAVGEAAMSAVEINTAEKGIAIGIKKVFIEPI